MMSDLSPSQVIEREFSHITSQKITEIGASLRKPNICCWCCCALYFLLVRWYSDWTVTVFHLFVLERTVEIEQLHPIPLLTETNLEIRKHNGKWTFLRACFHLRSMITTLLSPSRSSWFIQRFLWVCGTGRKGAVCIKIRKRATILRS